MPAEASPTRLPGHPRLRRYPVILGVTLWTVLVINMMPSGIIALNGHVKGEDYSHFYVLGRIAQDRNAALLYDTAGQAEYMKTAVPGAPLTYFVPVYGPQVALFFAPFAAAPYLSSLALWSATIVLLYLASCWWMLRACPTLRAWPRELMLYLVASPALWQLVVHGQTSVLPLVAFAAGWFYLRSGRPFVAGLAFGVLFVKPQLALALGTVLAIAGAWTVLAGIAISSAAQLALGALWFGTTALAVYVRMISRLPAIAVLLEPKPYLLQSFRGFFALLPPTAPYALVLSVVCSIAVLILVIRHWRSARDPDMSFALVLLATILISPHASVYDLVVVTPALMVIVDRLLARQATRSPEDRTDTTGFVLAGVSYLLPLLSLAAAYVYVQPSVIVLTWLVVRFALAPRAAAPQALPGGV